MRTMPMNAVQAINTKDSPFIHAVQTEIIVVLKTSLVLLTALQNRVDFQARTKLRFVLL